MINIQADGSGLYTIQALWTQAREKLPVITVVCANSIYNILRVEQQKQDLDQARPNARNLTSLDTPRMDWCKLAEGFGVRSARAETAEQLVEHLTAALELTDEPFVIEAMLAK